jgi:hypothetical protein
MILAVISASLSDRMYSGAPLASITSAVVSMTPKALMRRATLIARYSGLDDVAAMGQSIKQCGCHLGVAEHAGPFALRRVD